MSIRLRSPEVCAKCAGSSEVQDTRLTQQGYRYRRRVCLVCGHRWNTYETILSPRRIRWAATPATSPPPPLPPPRPTASPARPFPFLALSSASLSVSPSHGPEVGL